VPLRSGRAPPGSRPAAPRSGASAPWSGASARGSGPAAPGSRRAAPAWDNVANSCVCNDLRLFQPPGSAGDLSSRPAVRILNPEP
jgi:hypothetical protein